MFCSQCGTEITTESMFCSKCGAQLELNSTPPDTKRSPQVENKNRNISTLSSSETAKQENEKPTPYLSNKSPNKSKLKWKPIYLIYGLVPLIIFLIIFVWPTPWRYDHVNLSGTIYPVRINRIDGKTEILKGFSGWEEVGRQDSSNKTKEDKTLTAAELAKVEVNISLDKNGYIQANIYNGTEKDLGEMRIRIIILNQYGSVDLNREYFLDLGSGGYGRRLSSSEYLDNIHYILKEGQGFQWFVTGATWE